MNMFQLFDAYKNGKISTDELRVKVHNLNQTALLEYPLSEGQKGLWALQKMQPSMTAYNVPICLRLSGDIDTATVKAACSYVWDCHPVLKTIIRENNGTPCQTIDLSCTPSMEIIPVNDLHSEKTLTEVHQKLNEPFAFIDHPLSRICLFDCPGQGIILLFSIHHIIFDGISSVILSSAFLEAYRKLTDGERPQIYANSSGYKNFVDWQSEFLAGPAGAEHLQYWKNQLAGALYNLELPTDYARHKETLFKGRVHGMTLPYSLRNKVARFAERQNISLSTFFLGLYAILLHKYSLQDDILIGMATLGRPEEKFDKQVGYYINMIPIRSTLTGHHLYSDFIDSLQCTMFDGLDHSNYPFSVLVRELNIERDTILSPVFQTAFLYQNFLPPSITFGEDKNRSDIHVEFIKDIQQEGEYDLTFEVMESAGDFFLNLKYNHELFSEATVEKLLGYMVQLAGRITEDSALDLGRYCLLTPKESKTILIDWNDTNKKFDEQSCLHELVERQVNATPNAVAYVFKQESLTYLRLNEMSHKFAVYLQSLGVGPDSLVAICTERSLDMIVGIMAILKAGGAYVPLDPDYPNDRLQYMLHDSGASIILTQSSLLLKIETWMQPGTNVILLDPDAEPASLDDAQSVQLKREVNPENLAYVLYTSGSTGKPKGVMIQHKAFTNFLWSMSLEPGIHSTDRLLAVTTYCFDIAGLELFLPLLHGATCYLCSTETVRDTEKLKHEIKTVHPTIMQATPITWATLFRVGWKNEERVKILCGGEALSKDLQKHFSQTGSEVWNMFGPTETTIWSTVKRITDTETITIGKPIANTQIYILDRNLVPVAVGVPADLYIGGYGLAKGYLNLPALTEERFIDSPFNPGAKLYKTGDLARWLPSGEVECLGRADSQVKIHGFRVELEEIERAVTQFPGIEECAALTKDQHGHKQLLAFYVCKKNTEKPHPEKLKAHLFAKLPKHMVPSAIVEIQAIPLTPNKKTDKIALAREYQSSSFDQPLDFDHRVSRAEALILTIWKNLIGNDNIQVSDGFFKAGGNSIMAVIAVEQINQQFNCAITATSLFEHTSVRSLSRYIEGLKSDTETNHSPAKQFPISNSPQEKTAHPVPSLPSYYEDSLAVIGMSCQFPGANNYLELWANLINGKESIKRLSSDELTKLKIPEAIINNPSYVPIQSAIDGKDLFDPEFFGVSPRDAELMDPQFRLLLQHSWNAVEDAGYVSSKIPNTGVYISTSNNYYHSIPDTRVHVLENANAYVSWILGQSGTVPTLISYQLGFKGPSFAVHSNCSSSLVGLYTAYQAIRSGDVEYALVGASSIPASSSAGYLYQPGLNLSSDGHIKAFDSAADGMVAGEGVAVILLKNAKKAVMDNDNIRAILRGIGVNNDGNEKAGFYAPSVRGQEEVIQRVLDSTNVDPETITFLEAHGTGTKLGDPIELSAISKVFRKKTNQRQFCGIGSVKTNIGHLDTAAGLAGCIKVVLSLHNKVIPPTLNCRTPSPDLDLDNSPFYVVEEVKEWKAEATPRRAALSSFGIGGTNTHAIFEEFVVPRLSLVYSERDAGKQYLIPLSAKNNERLNAYAVALKSQIIQSRSWADTHTLKNIAYTLQVGRVAFDFRVAFIVQNLDELESKLEFFITGGTSDENIICGNKTSTKAFKVFEDDEDYQQLIHKWMDKGRYKKVAWLWVQGLDVNWAPLYNNEKSHRISLPTYPFAKEAYWRKPIQLATAIDPGVVANTKAIHPLITFNKSDFFENSYGLRLSGNEYYLRDHVINGHKILPGVIYLELARAAAVEATKKEVVKLKNIVWAQPVAVDQPCELDVNLVPDGTDIKYKITSISGNQVNLHCQGKILLRTTEFQDRPAGEAIFDIDACKNRCVGRITYEELYSNSSGGGYQYGETFRPIRELYFNNSEAIAHITLPDACSGDAHKYALVPSLMEGCLQTINGIADVELVKPFMPFSIEEIAIYGKFPASCYAHATRRPTSNSAQISFDINLMDASGSKIAAFKNYTVRAIKNSQEQSKRVEPKAATQLFHNIWSKSFDHRTNGSSVNDILVFDYDRKLTDVLPRDVKSVLVIPGHSYKNLDGSTYQINPAAAEDYVSLLNDLAAAGFDLKNILYSWSNITAPFDITLHLQKSLFSMCLLTQSLAKTNTRENIQLLYLVNQSLSLANALDAAMSGFFKTVHLEQQRFFYKTLLIDSDLKDAGRFFDIIAHEFNTADRHEVLWQHGDRYLKSFEPINQADIATDTLLPLRAKGVFLIIGGAGGLGLALAKHLVKASTSTVVLVGRSNVNDKILNVVHELELLGGKAAYIAADITNRTEVEHLIKDTVQRFGSIHGIINCAGIINDGLLVNKSIADVSAVISPKVLGTLWLDELTKDLDLDFFVLYSSMSSQGNQGQSDYAYANSFLNSFALHRSRLCDQHQRKGKTISINWPIWEEGGMRMHPEMLNLIRKTKGIIPLPSAVGLDIFAKALFLDHCEIAVFHGDLKTEMDTKKTFDSASDLSAPTENEILSPDDRDTLIGNLTGYILDIASNLLNVTGMDAHRDMQNYGFDSIRNTELVNKINDYYGLELMPTIFFELDTPTIRSLANAIFAGNHQAIINFYRSKGSFGTKTLRIAEGPQVHHHATRTLKQNTEQPFTPDEAAMGIQIPANFQLTTKPAHTPLEQDSIAIVGIAGVFPQSSDVDELWDNLVAEKNLVTPVPSDRFDWKEFNDPNLQWGGFINDVDKFDAAFFDISPREAEVMDPQHRLFLQTVWRAIEDAGHKPSELSGTKTGIFVGIGVQDYTEVLGRSAVKDNPYVLTGKSPFMAVNRISSLLNLHGPSEPIDTACSSSLVAIHRAVESIMSGSCEMAIAGGVNAILTPSIHLSFSAAGMLSEQGTCRTFDQHAAGTIRAEGVGAVFIKKLSQAILDRNPIYAAVKSTAVNHKGKSNSLTAPNANSQAALLIEAYERADIDPLTIDYIEAHSTGTRLGDPIEITALKKAFEEFDRKFQRKTQVPHCGIGSIKSNLGHLETAAGVAAVIKVLLALKHKTLPGTVHFNELNPYINLDNSPFYIVNRTIPWPSKTTGQPRRAGVSAFGFGGVNAHVVLEEFTVGNRYVNNLVLQTGPALIAISAKNEERLLQQISRLIKFIDKGSIAEDQLFDLAYTLQVGREAMGTRLAFIASSINELHDILTGIAQGRNLTHTILRAEIKSQNDALSIFSDEKQMDSIIDSWIKEGKYEKLLELWTKGIVFDWHRLYSGGLPQRISIPTYPFEPKRHWAPAEQRVALIAESNLPSTRINDGSKANGNTEITSVAAAIPSHNKPSTLSTSSGDNKSDIVIGSLAVLLGVAPVDIDVNKSLEEIGLDSIILMQLLRKLQQIDSNINFESLYQCKTINDICSVLSLGGDNKKLESKFPELVRLNTAPMTERPVFWFHGGFGGVEVYRLIAPQIKRPFFGIQARGYMTEREPLQGLQAMGAYYVQIIQSVQPEGPYDLGGLSLGGIVAYEVARLLQDMGEKVNSVIMLESFYIDKAIRDGWLDIPLSKLTKDRMLRSINVLLAFTSTQAELISQNELDLEASDEDFLSRLAVLASKKSPSKTESQYRKLIQQFEKVLNKIDFSTTFYDVLPLAKPDATTCYYFYSQTGEIYGDTEGYFKLVDRDHIYDFATYSEKWSQHFTDFEAIKVEASNHMGLLTEAKSQEHIIRLCNKIYDDTLTTLDFNVVEYEEVVI